MKKILLITIFVVLFVTTLSSATHMLYYVSYDIARPTMQRTLTNNGYVLHSEAEVCLYISNNPLSAQIAIRYDMTTNCVKEWGLCYPDTNSREQDRYVIEWLIDYHGTPTDWTDDYLIWLFTNDRSCTVTYNGNNLTIIYQ